MIDAIRYPVDNGIKWRAMPADIPARDRVYAFFRRWRDHRLVTEFHDRLRNRVRESDGRETEPTAAMADSQSVREAASAPARRHGASTGPRTSTADGGGQNRGNVSGCCRAAPPLCEDDRFLSGAACGEGTSAW